LPGDDLEGDSFVLEGDNLLSHSKTKESPSTSSPCHSNSSSHSSSEEITFAKMKNLVKIKTINS